MTVPDSSAIQKIHVEHALQSMSDAFILLDREFRVVFVNPATERAVEAPAGDLIGRSHWEAWPFTLGTEIETRYRNAMESGEAQHFQHHHVGDGLDLWLEINAYPGPEGLAVYFRDVSERKIEQEAAARVERAYKAALSNTPDLVYVFDLDHRFTYANEALLKMWGRTAENSLGKNCLELGYPEWHAAMHDREIEEVRTTKKSILGTVPFHGTYGRRMYEYIFVPVLGADVEVESIAGTTRDVTERLKTEEALRQSEKLATAGRLASSIAHEINNPLEAVTNLLYLMASDTSLNPDTRHYLHTAQSELARVSHITTQTLRFYRQSTKPTREEIRTVLESVVTLFDRRLQDAGVTLVKDFRSIDPVMVFAGELRQVVANLVGNALDALGHGGRIILREHTITDRRSGRPGVMVTVCDDGHGMSADTVARVFEPFFSTKGDTGTGLGLWVSQEIVEKHGGWIRVRSSQDGPRCGTCFSIFLPEPAPQEM